MGGDATACVDLVTFVLLRRNAAEGSLKLWLQHAECDAPTTGAEVELVYPGKIFMTRGWGEVARVCRA